MKRARRIKQQEQTSEIEDFLSFASEAELWLVIPVLFTILPPAIKADYHFFDSETGLAILYDRPDFNCNFVPAVEILLKRWERVAPAQCSFTIAEATEFLRRRRSK